MSHDGWDVVPETEATCFELVPTRRNGWVPAPSAPGRRAARTARAWLRETHTPADPRTYLGAGERVRIRTHLHWLVPLRSIVSAAAMMPLAILLGFKAPNIWWLQIGLGLVAVAHQLFLLYRFLVWRTEQIIVTDQRIVRTSGVFTTRIDAVHLDQITDSTYHRGLIGHVLGYGTCRLGSAGQNQSLERVDYVPRPGDIYRATLPTGQHRTR